MKKLALMLLTTILLLNFSNIASAAETGAIVEMPGVKIIMDGKLVKFTDVPICIGQNTLLPLRELFNNLGVPDENISYNDRDRSVTVTSSQTTLYMAVGNLSATVNGSPVKLAVAPVGYEKNNRIYIPFRFAAEALGRKVVWDGSSRAILVCDAVKYDNVKQILDKSNQTMKQVRKCAVALDLSGTVKSGKVGMKIGLGTDYRIDRENRTMYMKTSLDMFGMQMATDTYYAGNASYTQNPLDGSWMKQTYPKDQYDEIFENESKTDILASGSNEALCAGLIPIRDGNSGEIVLKGDVYLNELFRKAMSEQQSESLKTDTGKVEFQSFYLELAMDSSTYLLKKLIMHVTFDQTQKNAAANADFKIQTLYSEFNGDFQIEVPEEAKKNAVEKAAASTKF